MSAVSRRGLFGLLAAAPLLPVAAGAAPSRRVLGIAGQLASNDGLPPRMVRLDGVAVGYARSPLEAARMLASAELDQRKLAACVDAFVEPSCPLLQSAPRPAEERDPDPSDGCVRASIVGAGGGAGPATADTGFAAVSRLAGAAP